jgi:hypothetical protein
VTVGVFTFWYFFHGAGTRKEEIHLDGLPDILHQYIVVVLVASPCLIVIIVA